MGIIDKLKKALGTEDAPPEAPPGRNEPCWCGSGKKYKHCHLETDGKKRSAAMAKNTCNARG